MFCCLKKCLNVSMHKNNGVVSKGREPDIHLDAAHMGTDVVLLSNYLRMTGTGGGLATAPLLQSKSYFEVKIQQKGLWSIGLATRQCDLNKKFGGLDKDSWCLCSDNRCRHNGEESGPVVATTNEPKLQNGGNIILNGSCVPGLIGIEDINEDLLLTTGKRDCDTAENIPNKAANESVLNRQTQGFPDEGDIIGISFDHIELNFYINGKNMEIPFRNVKALYPVYPVIFVGNGSVLDIILNNFHYAPPAGFENIMLEQSLL